MQKILLTVTLVLATLTAAIPIPGQGQSTPGPHNERVMIGWKGIAKKEKANQFSSRPYTSGGGELGDVLYVADSTALAHFFAQNGYICVLDVNGKKWRNHLKHWVSQQDINSRPRKVLEQTNPYKGAVLFASHTNAGISDTTPWQLGIAGADIALLDVTAKCYPANDNVVAIGEKLGYDGLSSVWNIQGHPERGA